MGKLKSASLPEPVTEATRAATTLLSLIYPFEIDVLSIIPMFGIWLPIPDHRALGKG
jgi:hypothetical protein